MAKLYLKFEQNVLKELPVSQGGIVTIGRLPDNVLQIDNLAVSGHHAKIYWQSEHYVLEDNQSLNGTYVNNQRITKTALKDGDTILIGKHTVIFKDEWHEDAHAGRAAAHVPVVPKIESTVVLDTKKAREMMAQAKAAQAGQGAMPATQRMPVEGAPAKEQIGTLTVLEGKTDSTRYTLTSKMSVIGKSAMASIKLKGSFFKSPPDVAAIVNKRDSRYYIAPQDKKAHVMVNGVQVEHQQELMDGDVIDVAGVKMTFGYSN
ncbi:MAG: FHA domain-containing protein [Acidobacteriales bacterium]|nr:FHA domain-containing protein [Terriglobales bacterium]